jgi:aerobic carbon-monoxide dehydrogenase medium subunit
MSQTVIEKVPTGTQNERTATAQVVTRQPDGPGRRIGKRGELTTAAEFFGTEGRTILEPAEIITAVTFRVARQAGYIKFLNPAARYAMVGAFAARAADGSPRIAITGARPSGPFRWLEAETLLVAGFNPERLEGFRLAPEGLLEDLFADASYRSHLVQMMARRAVALVNSDASPAMVLSHGTPMRAL